jgi:hypothetical protein
MQHRYVGDVGDFAKYALLRRLAGTTGEHKVQLGVVWCLYPNESHNGDGRHISYLYQPEFAELDADLLAALRQIVELGHRSISAVERADILPRGTIFCDAVACLPKGTPSGRNDRLLHRTGWLEACLGLTESSGLVFFDPDNGIEAASIPKHHPNAGKYIYWDELAPFWRRGQALLIYHHFNRTKPAVDQVAQSEAHLQSKFEGALIKPLVFRRGSCRIFWLVCPRTSLGREIERRATAFLSGGWTLHFRPFD